MELEILVSRDVKMKTFNEFKDEVDSVSDNKEKDLLVKNYVKERMAHGGFPIVEDEDVTFVYVGDVTNKISIVGDMNNFNQEADHLQKLEGTNLYYKRMKFPLDSRIIYGFMKNGEWMCDSLNKKQSFEGLGTYSELRMPKYAPPKEAKYNPNVPHGKISAFRFYSKILDNTRIIHLYLPPDYDPSEKYPTIYAQDGSDYMRYGFFDNSLDNLIKEKRIKKVIVVFVDPDDRLLEYDLNKDYVNFLIRELVPYIDANYPTIPDPSERLVIGASFGGLIAVYIAFNHPEVFGNVASQSGYLSRKDDHVIRALKESSKKKIKFYVDCGTYESNVGGMFGNFTEGNRRMHEALQKKGYEFVYQEFHEGHNWGNWRSRIGSILKVFFGHS